MEQKKELKLWQIALIIAVGVILIIAVTGGGKGSNTQVGQTGQTGNGNSVKTYGLNQEAQIKGYDNEYTLTITGIREMQERNQFSEKNPAQVFLIDYTYKNLSGEELYISDMDFTVIDAIGEVGDTYPNSVTDYPKTIPAGATCKAQMIFCVNNRSQKITLRYKDNMFQSNTDAIFEIGL